MPDAAAETNLDVKQLHSNPQRHTVTEGSNETTHGRTNDKGEGVQTLQAREPHTSLLRNNEICNHRLDENQRTCKQTGERTEDDKHNHVSR